MTSNWGQSAPDDIDEFAGNYRFLSNFHRGAPVVLWGCTFPSTEHAFQAAKALTTTPAGLAHWKLLQSPKLTCRQAKNLGKAASFNLRGVPIRPDWANVKTDVMRAVVFDKFTRHPDLGRLLLATGNARLIEGAPWGDTCWGVCDGVGENRLGLILMAVRAYLKTSPTPERVAQTRGTLLPYPTSA